MSTVNDFTGIFSNGALVMSLFGGRRGGVLYNVRVHFAQNHISFYFNIALTFVKFCRSILIGSAKRLVPFPNNSPTVF